MARRFGAAVTTLALCALGACQPQVIARDGGARDRGSALDASPADSPRLDAAAGLDRAGASDAVAAQDTAGGTDRGATADGTASPDVPAAVDTAVVPDAVASADHCLATCAGRVCGDDDGCGGRCLGCSGAGEVCNTGSWSCAVPCVPDCGGKTCGDLDGCGGRCTACPSVSEGCNSSSWTCEACSLDCGGHGSCFVASGSAACDCDAGYYHRLVASNCELAAGTTCEGVTCSGHGTCMTSMWGGLGCSCDPGYHAYGLSCTPENRWGCRDRDGSFRTRGSTRCSDDNTVIESCRDGDGDGDVEWSFGATPSCAAGSTCSACIDAGCNPAAGGQPCALEQYCLQSTHEMELWVCVESCDCTNCGDCGLGDGCYQGMQAFCGSCSTSPASVACRWPCSNPGDGCIPYTDAQTGAVGLCYPMEGCFSAPPVP